MLDKIRIWFNNTRMWFDKNYNYIMGGTGVFAGLTMISSPENVPDFIIILIGVYWFFEGMIYLLDQEIKNK